MIGRKRHFDSMRSFTRHRKSQNSSSRVTVSNARQSPLFVSSWNASPHGRGALFLVFFSANILHKARISKYPCDNPNYLHARLANRSGVDSIFGLFESASARDSIVFKMLIQNLDQNGQ
jgi:hypothetical protein